MLSKAELEALAERYEAKAGRAYMNYQETGISRYDRERRNAEDLASAMRMAASASDDYSRLVSLQWRRFHACVKGQIRYGRSRMISVSRPWRRC